MWSLGCILGKTPARNNPTFDTTKPTKYRTLIVPSTLNFVKNVGDLKFINGKVISPKMKGTDP